MKRKILVIFLFAIVYVSASAELLGVQPSIDFVISPETFVTFDVPNSSSEESERAVGIGANGVIRVNLKLANYLWWQTSFSSKERQLFSENILGLYIKNSYTAAALTNNRYLDMKIGGGLHGQLPLATLGFESGMLYSPISQLWTLENFIGFMGQYITVGVKSNIYFDNEIHGNIELLSALNLKLDVRNSNYNKLLEKYKQDFWIPNHPTTQKMTVGDITYFKDSIKNKNMNFNKSIYNIPIIMKGYERWDEKKIFNEISFTAHNLGNGKVGSDEYIKYTTKDITLNFSTEEDKQIAFTKIVEEYNIRQIQKSRIVENKRLNQNRLDYNSYPTISMATMGISYAPNPLLIPGKIYIADQMKCFFVINRMENGDYNIGQDIGSYGGYQFILKNASGNSMGEIRGYLFTDTALLRYLGTTEVITSDGYVRYLPYFDMLEKNPHENQIRKIIKECEEW